MAVDEIEAFKRATSAASARGWQWRPPFWIALEDGEWLVQAENENASIVRLRVEDGEILSEASVLDPVVALALAREHAQKSGLAWKPSFSLVLTQDGWVVGCSQSQFGGQTSIEVHHSGAIGRTSVNPK